MSRVSRGGQAQRPIARALGRASGHSAAPGTGAAPAAAGGNSTTNQATIATIAHPTAGTKAGLQHNSIYWQNKDLTPLWTSIKKLEHQSAKIVDIEDVRKILSDKAYDDFTFNQYSHVMRFRGCHSPGYTRESKDLLVAALIAKDCADEI